MTESDFAKVDNLLLNNPESWDPNEVAEALMEDEAITEWEPELYWRRTVLRRDKERLEEVLAVHLDSFREYREEENFGQFKYEIMQKVPRLSLSEQDAVQYDQLVSVYEFWRDFYLYMVFSRASGISIEEIVKDIETNLVTSGFKNATHLRDKIAELRPLIVQEAVNKVGAENLIFVDNDDWAVINREWYGENSKMFASEFGNRLCRGDIIGPEDIKQESLSFIADSFRLFVYAHEQNLQATNIAWKDRRDGREGVEALRRLLRYKEFANSFFSKVNDLDPSLVRDNVNPEEVPIYYPDGPDVLAAWIDFYAMMRFFNEEPDVNDESREDWSSKLITELTTAGVLSKEQSYTNKIYMVKKLIWDMAKESTQEGGGFKDRMRNFLEQVKRYLPLLCCPSV